MLKYVNAHHNACNSFPFQDPVEWPSRSTSLLLSSAPERDKLNMGTLMLQLLFKTSLLYKKQYIQARGSKHIFMSTLYKPQSDNNG